MNYYILPKNKINFNFKLNTIINNNNDNTFISQSIVTNLNHIFFQINKVCPNINIDEIINPLEFVHNTVPGTQLSVSKVKSGSNILFELLELFQLYNIFENNEPQNILNISINTDSISHLINMLRDETDDNITNIKFNYNYLYNLNICNNNLQNMNLLIFECMQNEYNNSLQYNLNLLVILKIILNSQIINGNCIIKIDNITNKLVIEFIYIICSLYDKVYLMKPNICSITAGTRYLICKEYNCNVQNHNNLKNKFETNILNNLSNDVNFFVSSIIQNDIPNYFLVKLEELNSIIAQQQLESFDQTLNILRNKNKDDKLDILKRNHIQKCIQWCEKNQLPHNKFIDKTNIFLNEKKKEEINDKNTIEKIHINIQQNELIN